MLVLSRKLNEKIYIGDDICITIITIERGKIRVGVDAPRDVPIMRAELLEPGQKAGEAIYRRPSDQIDEIEARHTKLPEAG